jgi:hypothetical protein
LFPLARLEFDGWEMKNLECIAARLSGIIQEEDPSLRFALLQRLARTSAPKVLIAAILPQALDQHR